MKSGNLNFLEPSEPLQACNGIDWFFGTILEVLRNFGEGGFWTPQTPPRYATDDLQLWFLAQQLLRYRTKRWVSQSTGCVTVLGLQINL